MTPHSSPVPTLFCAELRAELSGDGLRGYANTFDAFAEMPGYLEQMGPHAFDDRLADDVRGLYNHDPNYVLGRTTNDSMKLGVDEKGLHFDIPKLPDTSYAKDLRALVADGLVNQMSFAFTPGRTERGKTDDGRRLVTHTAVKRLYDVSLVTYPAYEGTEVSLRSLAAIGAPRVNQQFQSWLTKQRVARLLKECNDR